MVKCSFTGKEIPAGRGIMYVQKDGKILYFDSSKSLKNFIDLGGKPRRVRWTQAGRAEKAERMKAAEHEKK